MRSKPHLMRCTTQIPSLVGAAAARSIGQGGAGEPRERPLHRKPNPPPVSLLMTLATGDEGSAGEAKATFEFTDPSGKLASPHAPLNSWLSLNAPRSSEPISCPESFNAVYADMHDGDKKAVDINAGKMTIKPSGNTQTWAARRHASPASGRPEWQQSSVKDKGKKYRQHRSERKR
ncbi:HEATR2 [Symbiodinium natans]|uniref:HEATR2 protein n=1 Tax=Symbiodinium natans TaxID=878477 RepID=A0A812T4I5_9DINO|nr:HEATR2 [Symbiodinium natans]